MPHAPMIQQLLDHIARDAGVTPELLETHISWVIVAGPLAYKIKKPVKFAFVDFTTLEKREHFCREEVRLNRRFAPDIYLDVAPIVQDAASGKIHMGGGDHTGLRANAQSHEGIIDWAVKMRAFDANATLDRAPSISETQIDAITDVIAAFHMREPGLDVGSPLGSAQEIEKIVMTNLQELHALLPQHPTMKTLDAWTRREFTRFSESFDLRKATGMVKDCHGDLHLGNIAWVNGKPLVFDCIEFSDTLRCIDVINEIAFLFMDLCARGHEPLAWRMVNRYLETTGDYAGLKTLRFYSVYRALVRAKISLHQKSADVADRYLALAATLSTPRATALLLMHGYSGSGKTFWSQKILQARGMVRLRSDVERQRLVRSTDRASRSAPMTQRDHPDTQELNARYSGEATQKTFEHLRNLAQALLQAGYLVIIDATFLKQPLRAMFMEMAGRERVPLRIVDVAATPDECRARIRKRITHGGDASEADLKVLEQQLQTSDGLTKEERMLAVSPEQLLTDG